MFPNPNAPSFDSSTLPSGLSIDKLIAVRVKTFAIFSPTNPNKEGFDRRNMAQILPAASGPKLVAPGENGEAGPYLTVVGHDAEVFARQSEGMMGIPTAATLAYTQPVWEQYNEQLTRLSEREAGKVWKVAEGSGHVVQVDKPEFVAEEVKELLVKLKW